jgi:hypothetical protein
MVAVGLWYGQALSMFAMHVWDALERHVRQRVPGPTNIQQLSTAIEKKWDNISQATINSLINSMRRRYCAA